MDKETPLKHRIEQMKPNIDGLLMKLNHVLLDKEDLITDLVTGILAGGHVLLEGLPGL